MRNNYDNSYDIRFRNGQNLYSNQQMAYQHDKRKQYRQNMNYYDQTADEQGYRHGTKQFNDQRYAEEYRDQEPRFNTRAGPAVDVNMNQNRAIGRQDDRHYNQQYQRQYEDESVNHQMTNYSNTHTGQSSQYAEPPPRNTALYDNNQQSYDHGHGRYSDERLRDNHGSRDDHGRNRADYAFNGPPVANNLPAQPHVLAKSATSGAMFGVVAKIAQPEITRSPPSTLSGSQNYQPSFNTKTNEGPLRSPMSQPLPPIREQRSPPPLLQYRSGQPAHDQQHQESRPPQAHKAEYLSDRGSDVYREDSSGYGSASTHTERSYEPQFREQSYEPKSREQPYEPQSRDPHYEHQFPNRSHGPQSHERSYQLQYHDQSYQARQHNESYESPSYHPVNSSISHHRSQTSHENTHSQEPQHLFQSREQRHEPHPHNQQYEGQPPRQSSVPLPSAQSHERHPLTQTYGPEPRNSYEMAPSSGEHERFQASRQDMKPEYKSHQQDSFHQKDIKRHWTIDKQPPDRARAVGDVDRQWNNESPGVDQTQIKGVKAVKNLFENTSGSIPLPKPSAAYGGGNYSNTRPLPPRPRISSDNSQPPNQASYVVASNQKSQSMNNLNQVYNTPQNRKSYPGEAPMVVGVRFADEASDRGGRPYERPDDHHARYHGNGTSHYPSNPQADHPNYTGQDPRSGSNYTGQDQRSGSNYTGQDQRSGSNYTGQDPRSGSNYTGQDQRSGSNYTDQNPRSGSKQFMPRLDSSHGGQEVVDPRLKDSNMRSYDNQHPRQPPPQQGYNDPQQSRYNPVSSQQYSSQHPHRGGEHVQNQSQIALQQDLVPRFYSEEDNQAKSGLPPGHSSQQSSHPQNNFPSYNRLPEASSSPPTNNPYNPSDIHVQLHPNNPPRPHSYSQPAEGRASSPDPPQQRYPPDRPQQHYPPDPPQQRYPPDPPQQRYPPDPPQQRYPPDRPQQRYPPDPPQQRYPPDPPQQRYPPDPPQQRYPDDPPQQSYPPDPPQQRYPSDPPQQRPTGLSDMRPKHSSPVRQPQLDYRDSSHRHVGRDVEVPQDNLRPSQQQQSPASDLSNYVPSIVAKSYESFNETHTGRGSKEDWPEPPPPISRSSHHDANAPMRSHYGNQAQRQHRDQQLDRQHPDHHGNWSKSMQSRPDELPVQAGRYDSSQAPDNNQSSRRADHYGNQNVPKPNRYTQESSYHDNSVSDPSNSRFAEQSPYPARQPPPGREHGLVLPKPPRHPFDPVDDDDSSEGVDVDAPTPPPHSSGKWEGNHPEGVRVVPAGQRQPGSYRTERQPGDGLNDDVYTSSRTSYTSSRPQQGVGAKAGSPPRKPLRSSMKHNDAQESQAPDSPDWTASGPDQLNHDHSKDRLRVAKTGRTVARKPPTRQGSTNNLLAGSQSDNFEINVTRGDLHQDLESPIIVQESSPERAEQKRNPEVDSHKKVRAANQQESSKAVPSKAPTSSKLVFKLPSQDMSKPPANVPPLPDITEPATADKKKPPTYTGFGNTGKAKSHLGSDLLGQFKSARESALRSAAKKQERALKSVAALTAFSKRTPSPVKSERRPDNSANRNADILIRSQEAKKNENKDIYQRNKPKHERDSPDEGSNRTSIKSSSVVRRDESGSDSDRRGRSSRGRNRDTSPHHRHARSRSHDRLNSPERRRGRSRSRERGISPERRARSRSRERIVSPDRRRRDRSRDRDLDRDSRSRKSERYQQHVSPYKHNRDAPPYPRSSRDDPYHRSGEPEWVEQYRRRRANDDPPAHRRAWVNDPRWVPKKNEFDINEYEREVRRATAYNSDFEQPQRKQMIPSKLMSKPQLSKPPPNRGDWMKDLKDHNRQAARNRFGDIR